MKASEYQVGGNHYKSEYQHWDWAIDIKLGYLESAATKYITRWRGKNGVQDVEKAIHYLSKAKETFLESRYANTSLANDRYAIHQELAQKATRKFLEANGIVGVEAECMWSASTWSDDVELAIAIGKCRQLLTLAQKASEDLKGFTAGATPKHKQQGAQQAKKGSAGRADTTGHPAPFGYTGDQS